MNYFLPVLVLMMLQQSLLAQSAFSPALPPGPSSLNRDDLITVGIDQRIGGLIPKGLTFTDSNGHRVDFSDLIARKPTLLALVYYQCPNLCTLVLNGMVSSVADLRRTVGDGFQIVVVSIDPSETAELAAKKKKAYLRRYSRGENQESEWTFLVGDQSNISSLAQSVGYRYRYDPSIHQFAHGSGIMMVSTSGQIVQYFLGIEYSPAAIEQAIQTSEAGHVGSSVDQFSLLCYCYNPLNGPYGEIIFNSLRGAALLTVVALFAFIGRQVYKEQKRGRVN